MAVNARTEEFQHLELFDKPVLFTNARIDRSTVPKGWYCYDFHGTDDDPGELRYIGEHVVVNHASSVLMPEKLDIPESGRLDARDEFGFLDEGDMTLREFCEAHQLPYPEEKEQFHKNYGTPAGTSAPGNPLLHLGLCRKRRCGERGQGNLKGGGKADQERGGDSCISHAKVHLEHYWDLSSPGSRRCEK